MSIENDLSRIADAAEKIAACLSQLLIDKTVASTVAARVEAPVIVPAQLPTPAPAPAPIPAPAPAFQMPTPMPAPAAAPAPFSDHAGMMKWTMAKYNALGPEIGGLIQSILQGMGIANINNLAPEQYAEFVAKVEGIQ